MTLKFPMTIIDAFSSRAILIAVAAFVLLARYRVNTTWLIVGGALIGLHIPKAAFYPIILVLLVAVGADYNMLLIKRIRDEAPDGSAAGVARALAVTGGAWLILFLIFNVVWTLFAFRGTSYAAGNLRIAPIGNTTTPGMGVREAYALTYPGKRPRFADVWSFVSRGFPALLRRELPANWDQLSRHGPASPMPARARASAPMR